MTTAEGGIIISNYNLNKDTMIKPIIVSGAIMLLLDSIYLGINKSFFENQIMDIQNKPLQFQIGGAILCYIFLIFGLYYFIIRNKKSVFDAFLFGIVIYGVYETTNYALLKNWSIFTVIIDTLWGGLLFAFTTYIVNLLRGVF